MRQHERAKIDLQRSLQERSSVDKAQKSKPDTFPNQEVVSNTETTKTVILGKLQQHTQNASLNQPEIPSLPPAPSPDPAISNEPPGPFPPAPRSSNSSNNQGQGRFESPLKNSDEQRRRDNGGQKGSDAAMPEPKQVKEDETKAEAVLAEQALDKLEHEREWFDPLDNCLF